MQLTEEEVKICEMSLLNKYTAKLIEKQKKSESKVGNFGIEGKEMQNGTSGRVQSIA